MSTDGVLDNPGGHDGGSRAGLAVGASRTGAATTSTRRYKHLGCGPADNQAVLVKDRVCAQSRIVWNQLFHDLLGVSGVRCWRRVRAWTETGVWPAVHEVWLTDLRAAGALDPDQCAVDGSHVRALKGGHGGLSPVDRGQPNSKHHLIVDTHGIPLQVTLTGGNRNDITQLPPLVDLIPPVRGLRGRPRRKPREVFPARGYGHGKHRRLVRGPGITPRIARHEAAHGSGLG